MGQRFHAGATFQRNCKSRLRSLAEEFQIPLGQFLLCSPRIAVLKPPKQSRASEMAQLKPEELSVWMSEEEEADIKVFEDDTPEPRSFVDIPHSLIAKYANYSLQMFRLYVVCEGSDRMAVLGKLRQRVKDWDKD
jgi:hypothetical protein